MISQETKDQIEKRANEYRSGNESRAYTKGATKYAEKLEEKDKAYNELGVKFDKEIERWQERDADELEKLLALQTELAQLKEIAERMAKTLKGLGGIEAWINDRQVKEHFQETVYPALTAYAEWCKQNLK